jgi:hypothetical protein
MSAKDWDVKLDCLLAEQPPDAKIVLHPATYAILRGAFWRERLVPIKPDLTGPRREFRGTLKGSPDREVWVSFNVDPYKVTFRRSLSDVEADGLLLG